MRELARKAIKLHRSGGSRAAVIPRKWLVEQRIEDDAELVLTDRGILLVAPTERSPSIEDEPEFAQFLAFLARDALRHSEKLGDVGELMAGDDELFAGVEVE